jgi:general secretion pathway protein D
VGRNSLTAACLLLTLSACANSLEDEDLLRRKLEPSASAANTTARSSSPLSGRSQPAIFSGIFAPGTDELLGEPDTAPDPRGSEERITLNLLDVSIAEAAKAILRDILQANYSIDGRVTGSVTIQTTQPISRSQLLAMFDAVLRDNGAAMAATAQGFRILPASEAVRAAATLDLDLREPARPGVRNHVVSLAYVSAVEIATVLEPLAPPGMVVRVDEKRNHLVLSGTDQEVGAIKDTIALFDVDWMRGMSFALVPVKASTPGAIVQDLEQVFDTKSGPLRGVVRFLPNKRLRSVLVISSRSRYLREAETWIRKLDVAAGTSEARLHVYQVQNRTASELASVLQSVYGLGGGRPSSPESRVAPRLPAAEAHAPSEQAEHEPASGPETVQGGYDDPVGEQAGAEESIRIVSDDANNSLLIVATAAQFERIRATLEEVDSVPNQVLLEAVIAEVSLDDDLRFGVRWFFGDGGNHGTFSDALSGAVASTFPGFSYFLKANDIAFTLNALSSVTNVRVLSSPSLVVLDNRKAILQVGDQVPIVTQQSTGVDTPGAPIVNAVELKDTGVILTVIPRVNDSGRVVLDIEQEVSSVVRTTTSGIDSPTIRQRKVKTAVAVTDGEALALGGLIQERETKGKTKVPVLGDVPLLGNAFRTKTDAVARTELIIFIRPRVIRDAAEARRVTEEFRKQLSIEAPRVRRSEPTPGEELIRVIQ